MRFLSSAHRVANAALLSESRQRGQRQREDERVAHGSWPSGGQVGQGATCRCHAVAAKPESLRYVLLSWSCPCLLGHHVLAILRKH